MAAVHDGPMRDVIERKLRGPRKMAPGMKYQTAGDCPGFEFDPIFGFQGRCKVCKFSKAEHPNDPLAQLRLTKMRKAAKRLSIAQRISRRARKNSFARRTGTPSADLASGSEAEDEEASRPVRVLRTESSDEDTDDDEEEEQEQEQGESMVQTVVNTASSFAAGLLGRVGFGPAAAQPDAQEDGDTDDDTGGEDFEEEEEEEGKEEDQRRAAGEAQEAGAARRTSQRSTASRSSSRSSMRRSASRAAEDAVEADVEEEADGDSRRSRRKSSKRLSSASAASRRSSASRRSVASRRSSNSSRRSNSRAAEEEEEKGEEETRGPVPVATRANSKRLSKLSNRSSDRSFYRSSIVEEPGVFVSAATAAREEIDEEADEDDVDFDVAVDEEDDALSSEQRASKRISQRSSQRKSLVGRLSKRLSSMSTRKSARKSGADEEEEAEERQLAPIAEAGDDDEDEENEEGEEGESKPLDLSWMASRLAYSEEAEEDRGAEDDDDDDDDDGHHEFADYASDASNDEMYREWVGRKCRALWNSDEEFHPATVTSYEGQGSFTVTFDKGTVQINTDRHDIQFTEGQENSKVVKYGKKPKSKSLWDAAKNGDLLSVEWFINEGVDVEAPEPTASAKTPLVLACENGETAIAKRLLAAGAEDADGAAYVVANAEVRHMLVDFGFGKTKQNAKLKMSEAGEPFDIVRERKHLSADAAVRSNPGTPDRRGASWPQSAAETTRRPRGSSDRRQSGIKKLLCISGKR